MNKDNEVKSHGYYSSLTGIHRAIPIILIAVGVFVTICFFTASTTGWLGAKIVSILLGLFSYGGYLFPALLILHGIFYPSDVAKHRTVSRIIFSLVAIISVSVIAYAVYHISAKPEFTPASYYEMGRDLTAGGVVGSILAYGIIKIFGSVGLIIITSSVFAIYFVYFFASGHGSFGKACLGILTVFASIGAFFERGIKALFGGFKNFKKKKQERISSEKLEELGDDEFIIAHNGMQNFTIRSLGIEETKSAESMEENPLLRDKVHIKSEVNDSEKASYTAQGQAFTKDNCERRKTVYRDTSVLDDFVEADNNGTAYTFYDDRASQGSRTSDSAESIFTRDFDPFDISANERLAAKPSSKARTVESKPKQSFSEDISSITEEDVERARRRAEFELKKRSLLNSVSVEKKPELDTHPEVETVKAESTVEEAASTNFINESVNFYAEKEDTSYITLEKEEAEPCEFSSASTDKEEQSAPLFAVNDEKRLDSDIESRYARVARFSDAITQVSAPKAERIEEEKAAPTIESYSVPEFTPLTGDDDSADFDEYTENPQGGCITLERERLVTVPDDMYSFAEDEEASAQETDGEFEEEFEEDNEKEPQIIPENERNPQIDAYRNMFPVLDREDDADSSESEGFVFSHAEPPAEDEPAAKTLEDDESEPPFDADKADEPEEEPKPKKPDYSHYRFPPIDILSEETDETNDDIQAEIEDNANKLISTLESFKVKASIKGVDRGPRITRYEVVPATGVKVSSVMSLQADLALNLAAEGIRMEAPIPGKSAIGFEIPNKHPSTVRLRSLLENEEFVNSKSKTIVCIGKDVAGCPVFGDIAKMPHVLIAGATGMGKSVSINSIMISMLYKARPDEVKFIMIDPKKVEFAMYNGIPHLLIPVVTEAKQAAGALMWAVGEMNKRYEMIEQMRVRNIDMYNEKVANNPSLGDPMCKIVIVIDELNELMLQVKDPVEGLIMSIAQKARAAGIHLIIGTQRPSVDVITGVIKANIPSRISCKVMSNTDSRTILDQKGAEDLLDKGDMLFFPVGKPKPARVQGAFVSDGEVEEIMEFLKNQKNGDAYNDEILEEISRNAQKCNKKSSNDDDDDDTDEEDTRGILRDQKFLDAVNIALTTRKISTSMLQRKLSIGYGRAAKYVDYMEDMGVVGEQNGQKGREVMMTLDEWHEKLARVSLDD